MKFAVLTLFSTEPTDRALTGWRPVPLVFAFRVAAVQRAAFQTAVTAGREADEF